MPDNQCLDHITAFLHGYHTESPLADEEDLGLSAMILAGNVLEVSYYLEVRTGILIRRMLPDHDQTTADAIAAANWQMEHWDEVEEAVTRAV